MISCCCNSWYLLPKVRKGDFISKKKLFMGGDKLFLGRFMEERGVSYKHFPVV